MAKILIVDDERGIRDMLMEYLAIDGHTVAAVGTGREALDLAEVELFDVALIDWILPGINGRDVLSQLARLQPDCIRVAITGHAQVTKVEKDLLDALVRKPFSLRGLSARISSLLASRPHK